MTTQYVIKDCCTTGFGPVRFAPKLLAVERRTPIMLVHGMFGDNTQWGNLSSYKREIIIPTLRGREVTSRRTNLNGVSIYDYTADVLRQMHEPSVIVGHSLGGLIAQLAASRAPGLVKGIVLLASTPPKGIRLPIQLRFMRYLRPAITGREFTLTEKDKAWISCGLPVRFQPESGRVLREIMRGVNVPPFNCPVLVIASNHDQFYPFDRQVRIADRYSAEIVRINSSHMFHLDPDVQDDVFRRIDDWIRRKFD